MWKNKIKQEKLQFILITFILILVTAIFSTTFNFYFSVSSEIEDYYEEQEVADGYLFNSSEEEVKLIKEECEKEEVIKNYNEYKAAYNPVTVKSADKEFNEDRTLFIAIKDIDKLQWKLSIIEGNKNDKLPSKGEIWISEIFADKRDLKLGDEIKFDIADNTTFKISAIIKDSQNGSLSNPAKIVYINEEDIESIIPSALGTFATFDDVKDEQVTLSYIDGNYTENQYFMSKFHLISNQKGDTEILSLIMAFAGLIVLLSGILVIRFTLKSNLLREYKSIGTYKALGFKDSKIKRIFKNAYLFVGIIGTVIGSLIGIPIAYNIEKKSLKYLIDVGFNINYLIIGIVTIVLFNVIVQLIVSSQLRKIKKITPIEAIAINDNLNSKSKKGKLFKNASNAITLAFNDIFKNKSMSITIIILITMYMFIILFFVNFSYSENNVANNYNVWLNLHKTSATINGVMTSKEEEEKIVEYLNNDDLVDSYGYGLYLNAGNYIKYDSDKYGLLYMYAIESFSTYDNLGFDLEEGRFPQKYNEINVSIRLLEDLNLEIGDEMTFKVNGKDESFKIVGSFGSIKYGGWNVRLLNSAMDYYGFEPSYNTIAVQLKDEKDFKEFKEKFENEFNNFFVSSDLGIYQDLMIDLTKSIPPVVTTIAYLMIILSILNIICIISMIIIEQRRNIGIQKALGFKDSFIKMRITFRVMLLSVIGVVLAVLIHNSISRSIIAAILVCPKGIVFSVAITIAYCVLVLLVILLTVYLSNLVVDKIDTIELMEE